MERCYPITTHPSFHPHRSKDTLSFIIGYFIIYPVCLCSLLWQTSLIPHHHQHRVILHLQLGCQLLQRAFFQMPFLISIHQPIGRQEPISCHLLAIHRMLHQVHVRFIRKVSVEHIYFIHFPVLRVIDPFCGGKATPGGKVILHFKAAQEIIPVRHGTYAQQPFGVGGRDAYDERLQTCFPGIVVHRIRGCFSQ